MYIYKKREPYILRNSKVRDMILIIKREGKDAPNIDLRS